MNKETFLQQLHVSPLSSEHKQSIVALIEKNGWNVETIEQIKDSIQADIDKEMIDLDVNDQAMVAAANENLASSLAAIEGSLAADMAYVEAEMHDLEGMVKDLDTAFNEAQMETLKDDIVKSA
ncbi:MAG: hypothetical protein KBD54_02620 [Candidatus Pacebacteria bacterium]|nr:hypothetical protein [Candidatus Paceibacterota bacterium]